MRVFVTGATARSKTSASTGSRRWLILGTVGLAQLMVVLDATIVNIALPSAQRDLGFSTVERQWVVTAYALAFGSLLLFGGRLGDLIGRKITFLTGAIGFAAASAVGGAATSFGMLIAARACQGARSAPNAPWQARAATSMPKPVAAPPAADAAAKPSAPARNVILRPIRSPSRPPNSSRLPNASA